MTAPVIGAVASATTSNPFHCSPWYSVLKLTRFHLRLPKVINAIDSHMYSGLFSPGTDDHKLNAESSQMTGLSCHVDFWVAVVLTETC